MPTQNPTQFQRVHSLLLDYTAADPSWLAKLYRAGSKIICIHLQDYGPVPRTWVDSRKSEGWRVWGMVRPSTSGAVWGAIETAGYIASEKRRLGLDGIRLNFEDEIELEDQRSGGGWSDDFTYFFRKNNPTLPAILDSYYGARGMNLSAYQEKMIRFSFQTYIPSDLWADPPIRIAEWTKQYNLTKAKVKVTLPVMKGWQPGADFDRVPISSMSASMQASGLIGCCLYHVDAAFDVLDEYLVPLVKDLIMKGAAY